MLFNIFFSIVDKGFTVYTDNKVFDRWAVMVNISGPCTKCAVGSAFFVGTGFIGIVTVLKVLHQKMCKEYRSPLKKKHDFKLLLLHCFKQKIFKAMS